MKILPEILPIALFFFQVLVFTDIVSRKKKYCVCSHLLYFEYNFV